MHYDHHQWLSIRESIKQLPSCIMIKLAVVYAYYIYIYTVLKILSEDIKTFPSLCFTMVLPVLDEFLAQSIYCIAKNW